MSARISLRSLFIVVAVAATATAVLLRPTFIVASAVWSLSLLILGAAIVAAFCSAGGARAFWAGFALFGCAHMLLALGPWFVEHSGRFIVTRQLLDHVGNALDYDVTGHNAQERLWENIIFAQGRLPSDGYGYYSYVIAGQSIFSLLIAYFGGVIGGCFHRRA